MIALGVFAALLQAWPRRILVNGSVESAVTVMALASAGLIFATSLISPAGALLAATGLLIPIIAAVPYLEVKSLRRLMIIAWVASIATAAASLLPDPVPSSSDAGLARLWGSVVVSGLVLFLLYQSTERLRASSREFSRLFSLSSDLAEATDPGVLGDLVARLAERAMGLLAEPFDLGGQSVNVSASIGVAVRTDSATGVDELIHEADEAMYAAKRAGKGRVMRAAPVSLGVRGPVA
ncbi:MAG TPA: diguanylate cyclase [Candidatus Limnocylindria bacterium]